MKEIACPCCGYNRHFKLAGFAVAELSALWRRHFGFDAFARWQGGDILEQWRCVNCSIVFHTPGIYGDDDFYARLSQYPWYYESEKWEFDVALDLVRQFRPATLLEVGCGAGMFLEKVSAGTDFAIGVDINPDAVRRARAKGLTVTEQPIAALNQSFDMIVLFEVLEHLSAPAEMLTSILDRLNPGGVLVLAVPNPAGYLKNQGLVLLDLPPHHATKWSRETFSNLCARFGLQEVAYETEPLRYVHYQAYIAALIAEGARRRSVRFVQRVILKLFGPFFFEFGRRHVKGQTHLVALRKPKGGERC